MSDIVVRSVGLKKIYRLYSKPHYRFLDMLGLLRSSKDAFVEHSALSGVNLEIRRGEKVAIIGRNGAGKSTLLKLISNVIEPTSGTLEVHGEARALLQIGSGFHPDFTGRENVYGYLAYLGITGKEADQKFSEIVEFSELEEYIEQPLKTYSSGMAVRLMFSTSTAIAPDILVLDEVLSVGDAYFSHKSFERVSELSERNGTTLLLVSHDVYSAAKVCPRMIWMDHGQILMDAASSAVIKAYEDSIREQEEQRLRKRKRNRLEEIARNSPENDTQHVILEIRSRNNVPQPSPVYFRRIDLAVSGNIIASLPLGGDTVDESGSHLQLEGSTWGEPSLLEGHLARPMMNFGSPFHKVTGVLSLPEFRKLDDSNLELRIEYWTEKPCDLTIRAFHRNNQYDLGDLPSRAGNWSEHRIAWSLQKTRSVSAAETFLQDVSLSGVHGSGTIGLRDVSILNDRGADTHIVSHGAPVTFRIRYCRRDVQFKGKVQVVVAVQRDGIHDVCRFITRDLAFTGRGLVGSIYLKVKRLGLPNGKYAITIMIAKEGYFDRDQFVFYSINPEVYVAASRILEFVVTDGGIMGSGTAVVAEGEWSIEEDSAQQDSAEQ